MKTDQQRVFIIAEAGVNHNGSPDLALQLVDAAAEAGADAVKFQTFKSEAVVGRFAEKAAYQKGTTGQEESQLDMVRKLELSHDAHRAVLSRCRQRGIQFLSTPFDEGSARFLVQELDVPLLKVPSGEITNAPLLLAVARLGRPLIMSTGMATLGEVELALGIIAFAFLERIDQPNEAAFRDAWASEEGRAALAGSVSLLHCTTEYPAPFEQTNLAAMDTLATAFGLPVGFSDHTPGISIPIAAVARGATIIEKHFTLNRNLPGPDHQASLEPNELSAMITGIRQVEIAIGHGRKVPCPAEWNNRTIARRSLVAAHNVVRGEIWSTDNLTTKRPADGISPLLYWEVLGRPASRDYQADEHLAPKE